MSKGLKYGENIDKSNHMCYNQDKLVKMGG